MLKTNKLLFLSLFVSGLFFLQSESYGFEMCQRMYDNKGDFTPDRTLCYQSQHLCNKITVEDDKIECFLNIFANRVAKDMTEINNQMQIIKQQENQNNNNQNALQDLNAGTNLNQLIKLLPVLF